MASPAGNVVTSSSIRPASTLDRSSTSLSRASRCRPASRMSCTYSAWRSLSSPNIRSSSTSEKPMTALSGVRSSCDMLARKSDLCWLVVASSRRCSSSCSYRRAFVRAMADWLAKAVSMSHASSLKAPGISRRTTSAPTIRSGRTRGITTSERHPASNSTRRCGSSSISARSGTCTGIPEVAARPTKRLVDVDADRLEPVTDVPARAVRRPHPEEPTLLVVLHERPAVGAGELDGVLDDRREHLVRVERRADRLPDLGQGLHLVDLARELGRACLEHRGELDVAQGERRLLRERRQQGAGVLVERLDRGAPDGQDADHLVVDDHRRRDDRAVAAELLELGEVVVGVGQHVVDLVGASVDRHPTGEGPPAPGHRVLGRERRVLRVEPVRAHEPVPLRGGEVDQGGLATAQPAGVLDDRLEDVVLRRRGPARAPTGSRASRSAAPGPRPAAQPATPGRPPRRHVRGWSARPVARSRVSDHEGEPRRPPCRLPQAVCSPRTPPVSGQSGPLTRQDGSRRLSRPEAAAGTGTAGPAAPAAPVAARPGPARPPGPAGPAPARHASGPSR